MRFSNLLTNCIIAVMCVFILIGCAASTPQLPRETIVFQYTPGSEAASGSANVTFAVVGTQLAKPVQQGQMQLPNQTPIKLFVDFASTMTKDFMEVLGAQGFGVRGPFKTYDDMIFPDKEGSDLILTAEVLFEPDSSGTYFKPLPFLKGINSIEGVVSVNCNINLVVSESLTNEKMWSKTIDIKPLTIRVKSHKNYLLADLPEIYIKKRKVFQVTGGVPIEVLLELENKFHNDLGHALEKQYKEILGKIYTYLDPREMTVVKKQSLEIRKKKVF